jgi:hypothetical protein
MAKKIGIDRFEHMEPAQPAIYRQHETLIRIYKLIREGFQAEIDQVFDNVSEKIGMVITTSLPFRMQIKSHKIVNAEVMLAQNEKASLYHSELNSVLAKMNGKETSKVSDGNYELYAFWHDALKMKLKTSWMEPVHFRGILDKPAAYELGKYSWMEPVHWFDPRLDLVLDEKIVISAIDEVYPDLRLEERVFSIRKDLYRQMTGVTEPVHQPSFPGVREPVHVPGTREPAHFRDILRERDFPGIIKALYEAREPVHFRGIPEIGRHPDSAKILAELSEVLKKYGF